MDIQNFVVNASQISSLMGQSKGNLKATQTQIKKLFETLGRDYQELSEPMKHTAREIMFKEIHYDPKRPSNKILSELILIYAYEMYGKGKVSAGNDSPDQLEKGNMAENAAIQFLSQMDGIIYEKNEKMFTNNWFKGIPDVLVTDDEGKTVKIIEVKVSLDLPSFIMAMRKAESGHNIWETMGYMELTGCKNAEIVHILVDMPQKIFNLKEEKLKERYTWLEIDPEVANDRIKSALNNMVYGDIPDEYKIFRRKVTYNKLSMKEAKKRATLSRKWLQEIDDLFTRKSVSLLPNSTNSTEEDDIRD